MLEVPELHSTRHQGPCVPDEEQDVSHGSMIAGYRACVNLYLTPQHIVCSNERPHAKLKDPYYL